MISKQLVQKTVGFARPPRVATMTRGKRGDIAFVTYQQPEEFHPSREGEDEWGCLWEKASPGQSHQGIVLGNPLGDWNRFENYSFPDPCAPGRFDQLAVQAAEEPKQFSEKYIVGALRHGPMHLLDHLLGFEEFMMALIRYPERIRALTDGIVRFHKGLIKQYAALGVVDAVFLADDQAMQTGPYFAMELWHEYLQPCYRELVSCAHAHGLRFFFHTCGNLQEHLAGLIECGVDLIDNKQPSLWMHSPAAGEAVGRVSFCTCLDMVHLLAMPAEQVEDAVHELIDTLSTAEGGFIGTTFNLQNPALNPEVLEAMWKAFASYRNL